MKACKQVDNYLQRMTESQPQSVLAANRWQVHVLAHAERPERATCISVKCDGQRPLLLTKLTMYTVRACNDDYNPADGVQSHALALPLHHRGPALLWKLAMVGVKTALCGFVIQFIC